VKIDGVLYDPMIGPGGEALYVRRPARTNVVVDWPEFTTVAPPADMTRGRREKVWSREVRRAKARRADRKASPR
jgi:hypothetical protein